MTTARSQTNQPGPFPATGEITTAVVTGGHPFDVPRFHHLLRTLPQVDAYPQHLEDYVADMAHVRALYDVILLFNWTVITPIDDEGGRWPKGTQKVLEELGTTSQGIVLLHHSLAAFPNWPFWSQLVGIPHQERWFTLERDLNLEMDARLPVHVVDGEHPITHGLHDWELISEAWGYFGGKPAADCRLLLTTEHPRMPSGALAWTHTFGKSRLFCLQPGHDELSWTDPNFQTVLTRGIHWAAGRLG